jgi:probable O-glycosylation ligase (exosortase A-associated)
MTFNSFFAADPDWSWPLWNRTVKIYAFVFLVMAMTRSKARVHAMIWVLVVSLGFYGAKGGVFTLISGGNYHVNGPDGTIIGDNNQLALALVMCLPLVYYLAQNSNNRWLCLGFNLSFPLQVATVLGSYSRGGVISLIVVLGVFWKRSRHKLIILLAGAVVLGGLLSFMPPSFYARMDSVQNAQSDQSFSGRLVSWQVAFRYASDHFPFGAGFAGPQRPAIYNYYFPGKVAFAAHSIYFQALGEHGFPGLILYLMIAIQALRNARLVVRRCRGWPELGWMGDLASMIEVALVGFYIGGAALSMAYYDGLLLLQGITSVLRQMTESYEQSITAAADGRGYPLQ